MVCHLYRYTNRELSSIFAIKNTIFQAYSKSKEKGQFVWIHQCASQFGQAHRLYIMPTCAPISYVCPVAHYIYIYPYKRGRFCALWRVRVGGSTLTVAIGQTLRALGGSSLSLSLSLSHIHTYVYSCFHAVVSHTRSLCMSNS